MKFIVALLIGILPATVFANQVACRVLDTSNNTEVGQLAIDPAQSADGVYYLTFSEKDPKTNEPYAYTARFSENNSLVNMTIKLGGFSVNNGLTDLNAGLSLMSFVSKTGLMRRLTCNVF